MQHNKRATQRFFHSRECSDSKKVSELKLEQSKYSLTVSLVTNAVITINKNGYIYEEMKRTTRTLHTLYSGRLAYIYIY